jgi:ATP-dependent helicase/DNAse subunit B
MPLTLVLGPANSAKAGEVLGGFAAASGRGAILVVPTALDADHYSRELAGDGAVLGSVLTFSGLAFEIASRAGYSARRLTKTQRERVLERAIEEIRFRALREASGTSGFPNACGELIAELERSLVTAERFASAMESWGEEDPRRRGYAKDVAAIYTRYVAELDRLGRVDAELFAWRALDALRAKPGRWGREPVFFYGFDDLHPLERDAIETLARVAGADVTVSLTYEAGRVALSARAEAVEELRPLAERVIELPALDEHYEPESREALHHLERWLFEPSPPRVDPGGAIGLLEAGGERAEAELAAAEVLSLLGAGVPGEEIAVVYRSLERAAPLIERVFAQYGIPVAVDRRVSLDRTTLGRSLLALARCAWLDDGPGRVDDLVEYLRGGGWASDLERSEVVDKLEAEVRRKPVRTAAEARPLLNRLGLEVPEIEALRAAEDPAAELTRHARRLLSAPHRGGPAPILGADEELDAHALGALVRALDELRELDAAQPSPAQPSRAHPSGTPSGAELIELLESLEVTGGPFPRPGAVLVTEPLAIRARRFRAVILCGLVEGDFPAAAAPEPFLSDELRRELAACSGLRLRPREDALGRERYLLYTSLSRATARVILAYRSSDEEGNLALASPFVADVAELLVEDWPERRRRRMLSDIVWPVSEAPTERELARTRAAAAAPFAGEVPSPIGRLSEAALAHVRHRRILSAGALESYGECPVRWLIERELQPVALEPDPDPLLRGAYMHNVIEQVLRALGGPVTRESLPRALDVLDEVLAREPHEIAPGAGEAVRAAAARGVAADLRRYLTHESRDGLEWPPYGLELRFGFDDDPESLPALDLGDEVRVRGIVDRVDASADGHAVVRDYKSGGARPAYQGARWALDRQLQVALYMLVVRELLGLDPVAGFYQPLGGGDLRARGVFLDGADVGRSVVGNDARDQDQLDELLADARERAVALAVRLREGSLEPCPTTCSRDGCRYPGICRA